MIAGHFLEHGPTHEQFQSPTFTLPNNTTSKARPKPLCLSKPVPQQISEKASRRVQSHFRLRISPTGLRPKIEFPRITILSPTNPSKCGNGYTWRSVRLPGRCGTNGRGMSVYLNMKDHQGGVKSHSLKMRANAATKFGNQI